ncbi:hypothetical protein OG746_27545 [Streptomyces sp. NBC_01016]|uniref:hypothetical protein n=1 Tax=Streptomyces sp. NBC_01016 TaxID=2903720 RepID=UPI0022532DA7|nr:hypothetical protein [Streptomyces sp. NBC_01016]MCX4832498.1 hypothetical protein [Streptomyces sp. NBC_01016]
MVVSYRPTIAEAAEIRRANAPIVDYIHAFLRATATDEERAAMDALDPSTPPF